MITRMTVFTLACSAWMFGCGVEPKTEDDTQETIDNLVEAGFPASDIMVVDGVVYVGGDAAVSLQASREMLEVDSNSQEHYRTTNLISSDIQTIFIHPTSSIPTAVYIGLQDAIANYNALALGIEFSYTPNPCQETPGCPPRPPYAIIELAINPVLPSGPSATSGFPSGGKPFPSISLGSGLAAYPRDTIEHVITHEIGHTIGFRHSDYFNRAISCGGSATNEGSAGVGAIHITGTPTGASAGGSLMNSCFPTGATGEFTASDVTALESLY